MKPEELVKMLRDAEMDDEAIKGLLNEALAALEQPKEEQAEPQPAEEQKDEEKEFNEFYGF